MTDGTHEQEIELGELGEFSSFGSEETEGFAIGMSMEPSPRPLILMLIDGNRMPTADVKLSLQDAYDIMHALERLSEKVIDDYGHSPVVIEQIIAVSEKARANGVKTAEVDDVKLAELKTVLERMKASGEYSAEQQAHVAHAHTTVAEGTITNEGIDEAIAEAKQERAEHAADHAKRLGFKRGVAMGPREAMLVCASLQTMASMIESMEQRGMDVHTDAQKAALDAGLPGGVPKVDELRALAMQFAPATDDIVEKIWNEIQRQGSTEH